LGFFMRIRAKKCEYFLKNSCEKIRMNLREQTKISSTVFQLKFVLKFYEFL
jgi:hypothetical protein